MENCKEICDNLHELWLTYVQTTVFAYIRHLIFILKKYYNIGEIKNVREGGMYLVWGGRFNLVTFLITV